MLSRLLTHPLARGVDPDDPEATIRRRKILATKKFLRLIYEEWYRTLVDALPHGDDPVLELGTGAGFLRSFVPGLITSDVLRLPDLSLVLDAHSMPFRQGSLRAVVMIDVLHHLSRPRQFLSEAARCVKPGGTLVMIEPWVSPWSRFVYSRLHHEPFQPNATEWEFPVSGPLSGANGALPWIVFARDRSRFDAEFPQWKVRTIKPDMPISYLLSGGISMRALAPGCAFRPVRWIEGRVQRWMAKCAMFATIVLQRSA